MAGKEHINARLLTDDMKNIETIRCEIARITECKPEEVKTTTVIAVAIQYAASIGVGSDSFRQALKTSTDTKRNYIIAKAEELGWIPKNGKEVLNLIRGIDTEDQPAPIEVTTSPWRRPNH